MAQLVGRAVAAILVAIALLACGATMAQAHDARLFAPVGAAIAPAEPSPVAADVAPRQTISQASPATAVPFGLLAALAGGATLMLVHAPRRLVALAVIPLIVLVMFETGVHGVHHLGDPRAAGQCSVAVTAEHIGGAVPDAPADVAPLTLVSASVVLPDSPPHVGRHHRPDHGRAPPAPSA